MWTLSVEEVVIIWETSLVVQPTFHLLSREETNYPPFFHGAMMDSSFRLGALLFRCVSAQHELLNHKVIYMFLHVCFHF